MKFTLHKILLFTLLSWTNISALTYEEYSANEKQQYINYTTTLNKEFKAYKKAYKEAFNEFKKDLKNHWKQPKITSKHKFVEYSKDLKSRKIVDYKKQNITLEVIANNEKEAKEKFTKMFDYLLDEDVLQATKNDIVEKLVRKKLHKKDTTIKSNQKIIADMINTQQRQQLKKKIQYKNFKTIKYKKNIIYKLTIKLPSKSFLKKAKKYNKNVLTNSKIQNIPPELIYAIIHSESSFNPMARSYVPAFGLMQIVPRTAGRDTYKYLYKQDKLLDSSYLYNSSNNIKIGSAYLHILYFRYLKKIKNPTSRLFCTIASYNTGAGNVSRVFMGNTNIYKASKVINKMAPQQVYKKLLKDLPHDETKHYLKKVYKRTLMYDKILKKGF
jgi:membrane-bound lytic murein transglycosylase C